MSRDPLLPDIDYDAITRQVILYGFLWRNIDHDVAFHEIALMEQDDPAQFELHRRGVQDTVAAIVKMGCTVTPPGGVKP